MWVLSGISRCKRHVRFTPESGHSAVNLECPPRGDISVVYSITSSAMERTPDGKVRPSALAVLRLMTNSNFVGRRTGKSAAEMTSEAAEAVGGATIQKNYNRNRWLLRACRVWPRCCCQEV